MNAMDRREFFTQAFSQTGALLLSAPNLLTQIFDEKKIDNAQDPQCILRSFEPINTKGEAFGARITTLTPIFQTQSHVYLVVGHGESRVLHEASLLENQYKAQLEQSSGITILDFKRSTQNKWRHDLHSPMNLRFHKNTPVVLQKSSWSEDKKINTEFIQTRGAGRITCAAKTPWGTVLLGETFEDQNDPDFGWVLEFNPYTRMLIKRAALGRLHAKSIVVHALSGAEVSVWIESEYGQCFKFTSHQKFYEKDKSFNFQILNIENQLQTQNVLNEKLEHKQSKQEREIFYFKEIDSTHLLYII